MIMSRRACFYLMSLLAAMALLVGCKSSKKAVEGETVQEKSRKALFQSLEANAFRYETMTARLNMTLRLPGKELSSRVDLRLARDSALQLSVQPFLGVELFRVELTTDSVRILDRVNKRYLVENYANFLAQIQGPNYYNFQALFTNHLFLLGKRAVGPADYRSFEYARGSLGRVGGERATWRALDLRDRPGRDDPLDDGGRCLGRLCPALGL